MSLTIMTVDDSYVIREFVSYVLHGAGYKVLVAEDGLHAVDVLGRHKADLIITDFHMPNMNGLDLIKHLRTQRDYKTTPILMLTSETDEAKKSMGRQLGVSRWIVKPFIPEKLLGVVKSVAV